MRNVLSLPKNFQEVKLSMEQAIRKFWASRIEYKEESTVAQKVETPENIALLYVLLTDYMAFMEKIYLEVGDKLLSKLDANLNSLSVKLPDYGKKVELDTESNWLFVNDFTKDDWYNHDMAQNREYLEKNKQKKE